MFDKIRFGDSGSNAILNQWCSVLNQWKLLSLVSLKCQSSSHLSWHFRPVHGRERWSDIKRQGMLVVPFRIVNAVLVHARMFSIRKSTTEAFALVFIILSQTECVIMSCFIIILVPMRGDSNSSHTSKIDPWYLDRVLIKISAQHSCPFHMEVPQDFRPGHG